MRKRWIISAAVIAFNFGNGAAASSLPHIPTASLPALKCIYRLLKSSNAVKSIDMYAVDSARFAIEYSFTDKGGALVVYDIEWFGDSAHHPFAGTDKFPIGISPKVISEASSLEDGLDLTSKCHLIWGFDNLWPEPAARAEWQKIDGPEKSR